ncbi:MAG: MFS transporter [Rhodospirillaceae bacterium]|nr:MFS transporter [Rhodospirillaceae bacterium]
MVQVPGSLVSPPPSQTPVISQDSTIARSVARAALGNLVEWFDWYTYSAMSLYLAPVFFPNDDPTVQLMNTAAVFALGFIVRPLGSWLLGSYADIKGRKAALTLSVFMMCFGSLVIAVAPGYSTIGLAAPALLLFARLLQGISVGGEYGASATYITERAARHRRGFFASFQAVTGILGQLLAMAVLILLQFVFLTPDQLHVWGWRIPFGLGAVSAIVAFYLRRNLDETGSFVRVRDQALKSPLRELMRHPRALLTVCGLTLGGTVAYYTYTAYAQKFLVNTAGFSNERATAISAATLFIYMLLQPLFGALSDRIGRRPLLIGFGVLGTLLTVPIMSALATTSNVYVAFGLIMVALVVVSGYTSINAVVKAELFPTEIRALGVALPYAVTVSLFGGTAEYIALRFKNAGHEEMFYWYVAGCVLISLVVFLVTPDTRSRDLDA